VISALESENSTNFIDRNGDNSYPIITVAYQAIDASSANCERKRELFKFYHWAKTSAVGKERLSSLGGSELGVTLENVTINYIESYKCDGKSVLEYRSVPQHVSKAFDALLAISIVLIGNEKKIVTINFFSIFPHFIFTLAFFQFFPL
jgi:hypothetical protein